MVDSTGSGRFPTPILDGTGLIRIEDMVVRDIDMVTVNLPRCTRLCAALIAHDNIILRTPYVTLDQANLSWEFPDIEVNDDISSFRLEFLVEDVRADKTIDCNERLGYIELTTAEFTPHLPSHQNHTQEFISPLLKTFEDSTSFAISCRITVIPSGLTSINHKYSQNPIETRPETSLADGSPARPAAPDLLQSPPPENPATPPPISPTSALDEIDINAAYAALQETPDDDPEKLPLLDDVGYLFLCRFDYLLRPEDLDNSVAVRHEAVRLTPSEDPDKADRMMSLASSLMRRFEQLGAISDLEKVISLRTEVVQLTPNTHPSKPGYLNDLGVALQSRFERFGEVEDIESAIFTLEGSISHGGDEHKHKLSFLSNLSSAFMRRFEHLGEPADLTRSISISKEIVHFTPDSSPTKPVLLNAFATSLMLRFEHIGGNANDLDGAVAAAEDAVRLTPNGHPNRHSYLKNLGNAVSLRFERFGALSDLERSLSVVEEAVLCTPDTHPDKAALFDKLGHSLLQRYERLGGPSDLDRSISACEDAVKRTLDNHPSKASFLSNLGVSTMRRFERRGVLSDLEKSVEVAERAVRMTGDHNSAKMGRVVSLSNAYICRFERLGKPGDVQKAIMGLEDAVQLTSLDHPGRPMLLKALGNSYICRYINQGDSKDMEKSISALEDALRLLPRDHPDRPSFLNDLSGSVMKRFESVGDLTSLAQSQAMLEDALRLTPENHLMTSSRRNLLANSITRRFERLGELADIERSVLMLEEAVRVSEDDDPEKPNRLDNLGGSLMRRFERLGTAEDMDRAIAMLEDAVRLTPNDHPNKSVFLNNLGSSAMRRFESTGKIADIDRSISTLEIAARLTPDNHSEKFSRLNHLGCSFTCRFERFGYAPDLEKAISTLQDALRLTPKGHAYKPYILSNLGGAFLQRFLHGEVDADLEESISTRKEALGLITDDQPDRPAFLNNIGKSLAHRFEHSGEIVDLEAAIDYFSSSALSPVGPPSVRFYAAWQWAQCSSRIKVSASLDAYRCALDLLPRVAWLGLSMRDRHSLLGNIGKIVRGAAAAAIESGECSTALEWLEQGRSIVWGQLLRLRTPIDELRVADPSLATRISQTAEELEHASARSAIFEPSGKLKEQLGQQHRRLAEEWDELVQSIQTIPGFQDFLKPKKLELLKNAATYGPVVIVNVHKLRCDALVLTANRNDVIHVPLQRLSYDAAEKMRHSLYKITSTAGLRARSKKRHLLRSRPGASSDHVFKQILSNLWYFVVKPVLDKLALPISRAQDPPRIWWCLTGPLTFLPIHAAGIYETGTPEHKITDYVVSSYTPTLTAILDGQHPTNTLGFKLLAVIQSTTPGAGPLPGTKEELLHIQRHADNLPIVVLEKDQGTVDNVMAGISECKWAHFACHGKQDVLEPTKSGLLLQNGCLELSQLVRKSLPCAEFAFLSACQTATGDENLSEEAVHLAAGMLLVGYKGVIATMWSIKDKDAPFIADIVYSQLLQGKPPNHTRAAHALHHAAQQLRGRGAKFLSWVPFIHVGL